MKSKNQTGLSNQSLQALELEIFGFQAKLLMSGDWILTFNTSNDQLFPELEHADDEVLKSIVLSEDRAAVEWKAIGIRIELTELLIRLAGVDLIKSMAARLAGSAKSEKKAAAVRLNGAKGGRPVMKKKDETKKLF